MTEHDPALARLIDRVRAAQQTRSPLCIRGGGTKDFYGEAPQGEVLSTTELAGISSYQPTELVVTARCGTPLAELEAALADKDQCLPFEPPHFSAGGGATAFSASTCVAAKRSAVASVVGVVFIVSAVKTAAGRRTRPGRA